MNPREGGGRQGSRFGKIAEARIRSGISFIETVQDIFFILCDIVSSNCPQNAPTFGVSRVILPRETKHLISALTCEGCQIAVREYSHILKLSLEKPLLTSKIGSFCGQNGKGESVRMDC